MTEDERWRDWFAANRTLLEGAYLRGQTPWQQSGFGLHTARVADDWQALRRPVCGCLLAALTPAQRGRPVSLLDIGCANGYLLQTCVAWAAEAGVTLDPWGLDISEPLVTLARERLPAHAQQIAVGNAWSWAPPRRFEAIRTELVYVPEPLRRRYVARLLADLLVDGGLLLVAEYAGHTPEGEIAALSIDATLQEWGYTINTVRSGFLGGSERTRIAAIRRSSRLAALPSPTGGRRSLRRYC